MQLQQELFAKAEALKEKTIERRRDLHRYPEAAWMEFRTAALAAKTMSALGYEVAVGEDTVASSGMMGVPSAETLDRHMARAIEQGADPAWVRRMVGGKTGVVAVLRFAKPGPTVGLRFDMDANDVVETSDAAHRPNREGFGSCNTGAMHACGHDGHTSVGLAVAEVLAGMKDKLAGTVKLVFQPAEEGVRGARAMVERGVVDDVDYMLGAHFGFQTKKTGQLACNVRGFLATSKYDAVFTGVPAHAGAAPETGKNALLAAACAALNLHAISRHGGGTSRINVGVLLAGSGRNVIPANAVLKLETRGASSEINAYMAAEAKRVIESAAAMYGVAVEVHEMGGAAGGNNSSALSERLAVLAGNAGIFGEIVPDCDFGASEDFSYFMERVQQKGGQAAYMMVGAELAAGHHDARFDFDETALDAAVKMIALAAADLLTERGGAR